MHKGESIKSHLDPLAHVIEELASRREDGFNDFTKEEPAVARLLNCLDVIFGADPYEPGGFIDFIKTVVQSLPYSALTHDPVDQVLQKNFSEKLDAMHFWIISCLNVPGSMKQTLHLALPQKDVLTAFVNPTSPLVDSEFCQELLVLLSLLHNHPTMKTTLFNLDITAEQLFNEKAQPVNVVMKRRTKSVKCTPKKRTVSKHEDAMSMSSKVSRSSSKVDTASSSTQTIEESMSAPNIARSLNQLPLQDSWMQTDNPTLHLTYQDVCDMEKDLSQRDRESKQKAERLQRREQQLVEAEQDANDKLTALTHTLKSVKVLYNDLFTAGREAQSDRRDIREDDVSALIPALLDLLDGRNPPKRANVPHRLEDTDVPSTSSFASSASPPTLSPTPLKQKSSSVLDEDEFDVASPDDGIVNLVDGSPNVAPHSLEGCRELVLQEPVEKERNSQLQQQQFKCPSCSAMLAESSTNTLLKVVQKAGDALRVVQKPRRCHYCTKLFCHKCHTNKNCMLPFRVVQRWDFTQQHVCDGCYRIVRANMAKAVLNIKQMPLELQQKANVVKAVELRRKLFIASRVLSKCATTTAKNMMKLHYFQKERYFSISDFSRLRGGEGKGISGMNMNPLALAGGGSQDDLNQELEKLCTQAKAHVMKCAACLQRGSMECKICRDSKRVHAVDDDAAQCKKCYSLYHNHCLSSMECRVCHH